MSGLQRRLKRLEGGGGLTWVCASAPEAWPLSKTEAEATRLATERGHHGPFVVIPFRDPVETDAAILDISHDVGGMLNLFNVIVETGKQARIRRQRERAERRNYND